MPPRPSSVTWSDLLPKRRRFFIFLQNSSLFLRFSKCSSSHSLLLLSLSSKPNSPPETVMFSTIPTTTLPKILSPTPLFPSLRPLLHCQWRRPMCLKTQKHSFFIPMCSSYQVGGIPQSTQKEQSGDDDSTSHYEALLKGGEQVASVLQEMVTLVCPLFLFSSFLLLSTATLTVGYCLETVHGMPFNCLWNCSIEQLMLWWSIDILIWSFITDFSVNICWLSNLAIWKGNKGKKLVKTSM